MIWTPQTVRRGGAAEGGRVGAGGSGAQRYVKRQGKRDGGDCEGNPEATSWQISVKRRNTSSATLLTALVVLRNLCYGFFFSPVRISIKENIDSIRLQKQLSEKNVALAVLQEKFNNLNEVLFSFLVVLLPGKCSSDLFLIVLVSVLICPTRYTRIGWKR